MICPKCQSDNPDGAKFCNNCGNKLEIACSACGKMNLPGSRFCIECGQSLEKHTISPVVDLNKPKSYTPKHLVEKILTGRNSIEGERKVVTVLFADVVNFTSLAEKLDPEEVHQIMDSCFRILMDEVHKYEGTINQFTGDGIMALFGAPVAHEDHARQACYSALAIQKAIGIFGEKIRNEQKVDFVMRIGLNSGQVVVGSIGNDLRMDYTAIGDTTNLAARMESIARPGTIMCTIYTHKFVRDFFVFKPVGKVLVKGKENEIEAYELIMPGKADTRIAAAAAKGFTKFVGRQKEMYALEKAFNSVRSGHAQVVGIVGEAGTGKSRLCMELLSMFNKDDYTYLEGRCVHYGYSIAYLPLLYILRSYFGIREGEQEETTRKKMVDKILQLDGRLKSSIPPFQELLSLKIEDSIHLQLQPQQKKEKTFKAIEDLFIEISKTRPLVLVIEDLHWIDKTSEEFLNYLIDLLPGSRILLILLYRTEYKHAWDKKPYYIKIEVDQLSNKSSASLVQGILTGGKVVPKLMELILNRAGGNPLFVEELTYDLMGNGSIKRNGNKYVLTRKASDIEVPDTIQGIIAARIDRVEVNHKRILLAASVIGREFAYRILLTLLEARVDLRSSLINLQRQEFVYEKSLLPELEYIFKHALTQEVAYKSLLLNKRRNIHEKIGNAIEDLYGSRIMEYYDLLAYHFARSNNSDKAVEYLYLANQKAAKLNAMKEAKAYFEQVMIILDGLPETRINREKRISLLVNQWLVFTLQYQLPEYHDLLSRYEKMAINLRDQALLGAFFVGMGMCQWWIGKYGQAIQTLTKAVKLCETVKHAEYAGLAFTFLQWTCLCIGDFGKVLQYKEKALQTLEQQYNLRTHVWALAAASWAHTYLGAWDDAIQEGREALRVAEEHSDNSLISFAAAIISFTLNSKGDMVQSIKYGEAALQKASTPADKVWAQGFLAWARCRSGEAQKSTEILEQIVSIQQAGGFRMGETGYRLELGEGYCLAGNYDEAMPMILAGLELAENTGYKLCSGWAHRLLAEIAVKNNPDQAGELLANQHFEKSIQILKEINAKNHLAQTYASYGEFHLQCGNLKAARKYLTKALGIFERLGTLTGPDRVRMKLAELPVIQ